MKTNPRLRKMPAITSLWKMENNFLKSSALPVVNRKPILVAKNAGIHRSVLKITALPAEFGPSDGVTGAAQFALYDSKNPLEFPLCP